VKSIDLAEASEDDLAEMFFVLGPANMSLLLSALLAQSRTDSDMNAIASLSASRHAFYESVPA